MTSTQRSPSPFALLTTSAGGRNSSPTRRGRTLAVLLVAAFAVSACTSSTQGAPEASPDDSPSTSATTSADLDDQATALDGVWRISLTRHEIRRAMHRAGYGEVARRFIEATGTPAGGAEALLTLSGGRFSLDHATGASFGWSGLVDVEGRRIVLTDQYSAAVDTLRWRVTGDRVMFEPVSSTVPTYRGIPGMAYLEVYLGSEPLVRVARVISR